MILLTILWKNKTLLLKKKIVLAIMILLPVVMYGSIFKLRSKLPIMVMDKLYSLYKKKSNTDYGMYSIFEETVTEYKDKHNMPRFDDATQQYTQREYTNIVVDQYNQDNSIHVYYNSPTCFGSTENKPSNILLRFHRDIQYNVSNKVKFIEFDGEESMVMNASIVCQNKCNVFAILVFKGDICTVRNSSSLNFTMIPLFGYSAGLLSAGTNLFSEPPSWPGPRTDMKNLWVETYRVAVLQSHISRVIRSSYSNIPRSYQPVLNMRLPYSDVDMEMTGFVLHLVFSILISLICTFFIGNLAKDLSDEKGSRMKEQLNLMGVPTYIQWFASWFQYVVMLFIVFGIITRLMMIEVTIDKDEDIYLESDIFYARDKMPIFKYSSGYAIFIFLAGYTLSALSFSIMISAFFDTGMKSASAVVVGSILLCMPGIVISSKIKDLNRLTQLSFLGIFEFSKSIGLKYIEIWESTGEGLQLTNYWQYPTPDCHLTMAQITASQIITAIVYLLLAIYIECVNPGRYGIGSPYLFPLWQAGNMIADLLRDPRVELINEIAKNRMKNMQDNCSQVDNVYIESVDECDQNGIEIVNLCKEFPDPEKGVKVAVNNLNLTITEGQITVLLGHNGAGKTTTMFLLTGFLSPTSGTAFIYGMNMKYKMKDIRRIMGLCPQHNILYALLTVDEHLTFMKKLNPSCITDAEITEILTDIDMVEKRSFASKDLSGGMKRKLSIIQAMIGGSKVVILDEPTAGLDPEARRQTWALLKKYCRGKTLLISTHYMDEAEFLGDKIAIMGKGHLQSYGTSLFLKNAYGSGYKLSITKNADFKLTEITEFLQRFIPNARIVSNVGAELVYELPGHNTAVFEKMFFEFEEIKNTLGILSYGVSITTMEDVFIKVGEMQNMKENKELKEDSSEEIASVDESGVDHGAAKTYGKLMLFQLIALLRKRFLYSKHQAAIMIAMVTLPALVIACSIFLQRYKVKGHNDVIQLSLNRFSDHNMSIILGGDTKRVQVAERIFIFYDINIIRMDYPSTVDLSNMEKLKNISKEYDYALMEFYEKNKKFYMYNLLGSITFDEKMVKILSNDHLIYSDIILNYVVDSVTDMAYTAEDVIPYRLNSMMKRLTISQYQSTKTSYDHVMMKTMMVNTLTICIIVPMAMSGTSMFVTDERIAGIKAAQYVSGMNAAIYWISNFIIDYIISSYMVVWLCFSFYFFDLDTFGNLESVIILFTYIFSVIPNMYLFSFFFKSQGSTFVWTSIINISTGSILPLVANLALPKIGRKISAAILPNMNLYFAIDRLNDLSKTRMLCPPRPPSASTYCEMQKSECCLALCKRDQCPYFEPWSLSRGVLSNVIANMIMGTLYLFIVILIDLKVFVFIYRQFINKKEAQSDAIPLDKDILTEKEKVENIVLEESANYSVIMKGLIKVYKSTENNKDFKAVDNLNVAINKGECFGLLGVNGAGKTSTFAMLTGMEPISGGFATICGYDVATEISKIYQEIGYCQQFDKLFEYMSCKENIDFYCQVKGIGPKSRRIEIKRLLKATMLTEHSNLMSGFLSGGNKRKLSTAISMIGQPKVVFLDEPTCGMDPVARRHSWTILSAFTNNNRTIVLTSHSMEECEALCERLVIMVKGVFRCIGTPQHLKNIYGHHYTLIVQVHPEHDSIFLDLTIKANFYKVVPVSSIHNQLIYKIPKHRMLTWSMLFKIMERLKEEQNLCMRDYSIAQPSLEQIFIGFAEEGDEKVEALNPNMDVRLSRQESFDFYNVSEKKSDQIKQVNQKDNTIRNVPQQQHNKVEIY